MTTRGLVLLGLLAAAACGSSTDNAGSDAGSGGASSGCRGANDCGGGYFCAAYTLPPLCGGQVDTGFTSDCQTDADCADAGTGYTCETKICTFPHGGAQPAPHCRPGCSADADCGPGSSCNAAHHCEPAACTTAADCGSDYACSGGSCAPKPCSNDADCGGYCVNGVCSATIGVCEQAVP
jgi:hypothetical protein